MSILSGTATIDDVNGADYYLKNYNRLPKNYITKEYAEAKGWVKRKGNLAQVCPNLMIGGIVFKNKEGKLLSAPGRVWCEADINYLGEFRNSYRVLYSNDGLIFATYDHYLTFFEIV